jgi:hypothetical protein
MIAGGGQPAHSLPEERLGGGAWGRLRVVAAIATVEAIRQANREKLTAYRRPESRCASFLHRSPDAPVEDGERYRSPDGKRVLVEYEGEGLGWGFFLHDQAADRFWFREVDGPEHGVSIYGPFPGDVRGLFSGLRKLARRK